MDEMKTWGRLRDDEKREVIEFMKRRRTKYGNADTLTMLIVAFVVAAIGLVIMALVSD